MGVHRLDTRLVAGLENNGKSININLVRLRFHAIPPSYQVARTQNKCKWCHYFQKGIGARRLCTFPNNISGETEYKIITIYRRANYRCYEFVTQSEYKERIIIYALNEKRHEINGSRKRALKRAEIREKRVKERVQRENHQGRVQ